MDTDKTLNDILVKLFNDLMEIEEKCLIYGEFSNMTNNDMHVVEAIGVDEPKSMSQVAKLMDVTTGTLTKAIDGLVDKGYVIRKRSEKDKRVVRVTLTEAGVRAYEHHARFHKNMITDVKEGLNEEETKLLIQTLGKLVVYFQDKYQDYLNRGKKNPKK